MCAGMCNQAGADCQTLGPAGGLLRLQLPSWAASGQPGLNAEPTAEALRLRLSSPADPDHFVDFRWGQASSTAPPPCSHMLLPSVLLERPVLTSEDHVVWRLVDLLMLICHR